MVDLCVFYKGYCWYLTECKERKRNQEKMFARSLALVQRVAFRTNTSIPSMVFKAPVINIQRRNLITIMTEDEEGDDDLIDFANQVEYMGSESHPGYRRVSTS